MSIFENFEKKLQAEPKSIVFTEGTDARILSAAAFLAARNAKYVAPPQKRVAHEGKLVYNIG